MTRVLLMLGLFTSAAMAQEPAPPPAPVSAEAALAPLEAAYQKEYAYLLAEREELQRRLAAHAAEAETLRARARSEVSSLQTRLASMQVRVESADLRLADADRATEAAEQAADQLNAAWFQASQTLGDEAGEAGEGMEAQAASFARAYGLGLARVDQGGQVLLTDGAWFGPDGKEVTGQHLKIGRVATFGVGAGEPVALLPAGEGRFSAWRDGGGATASALLAGERPSTVGLFLHESATKRVDLQAEKTLATIVANGGFVGLVILALGAFALLLMAIRAVLLMVAGRDRNTLASAMNALESGRIADAYKATEGTKGVASAVLHGLLADADRRPAALDDIAEEVLLRETPRLDRFGSAVAVIAAVAPLLGLLGTVTGMIATFDVITEFGTGDPRMLSGGISAALVTTQFGLIVAIPCLLLGNMLNGWAENLLTEAEGTALRALNALSAPRTTAEPVAQASK